MKRCRRATDQKLFAVKEVRSNISDDYDKQCLENQILDRLGLANHPNIIQQEAFFKDPSKQTTQLVMEALNKEVDKRVSVVLYEVDSTFSDSIIYKEKPKYIAVTDSVSGFNLENIKEGTYLLAALNEENPNYTFQPDLFGAMIKIAVMY